MTQHHVQIIDNIDIYVTSLTYLGKGKDGGRLEAKRVTNYFEPPRIDIELPTEIVDYYRVFPQPPISDELVKDIAAHGITNPLRIYTNGGQGVLRDGHHRLGVALQLGLDTMPVHLVPNWLGKTYFEYKLPRLEPLVEEWLRGNLDFAHEGHQNKRVDLNKRLTEVHCCCGARWRENVHEEWERILQHPRKDSVA